ncbi:MAG: hypothetical protein LBH91_08335, partial [Prevotellaceae bacterium]|nr:hypothetical protein [Prevotellaceae bacterium]
MKKQILLTAYCLLLTAYCLLCTTACNNSVNVDHISVEIEIQRFDKELLSAATDTTLIPLLREKYGSFFEFYNVRVIEIGNSQGPYYTSMLYDFMQAEVVKMAHHKVEEVFPDDKVLNAQLTNGFKHLKYYFPDIPVPKIYAYVS